MSNQPPTFKRSRARRTQRHSVLSIHLAFILLDSDLTMERHSPFASYLGTNYAATHDETTKLTEFLVGPISKLNELQLEGEIDRIKVHYDSLVGKHMELSLHIERHQALMAPIRRPPVDVIQEIFLHCLPTIHNAVISSEESPILLTRICSGWRRIALNTAALWASIHIPIPQTSHEDAQHVMAIATAKTRAKAVGAASDFLSYSRRLNMTGFLGEVSIQLVK